ncbi:hypothetical protein SEUCBS139899_005765 [Sporothrix eucalyptigena]|uniref:Carbohydrate esterase family 5 protein n=1 Tax=Sporothrix eucalyptigena TaxID=1812306 RepID=A0ABP0BNB4_9PEZI
MRAAVLVLTGHLAAAMAANITCAEGLYMLCGRPSGAPAISPNVTLYGPDNTTGVGFVADKIAAQIPGSIVAGIEYPASDPDPDNGPFNLTTYYLSENQGVQATMNQVTAYHAACPNSQIALIGFSQGAQIIADALCGGIGPDVIPGAKFNSSVPLPVSLIESSVLAIALIADPTHVANTTYDVGNSTNNGVIPRANTTVCAAYSDRMQSYCEANDFFCDSGNSTAIHLAEANTFEDQVVQFVVNRWTNYTASKSGSSQSSSLPSPTPSSTTKPNAANRGLSVSQTTLWSSAGILMAALAVLG